MPSFTIPLRPEGRIDVPKKIQEPRLTDICNQVYDRHRGLIRAADPNIRSELLGGKHQGEIWALHQVNDLLRSEYPKLLASYNDDLKEAMEAAKASPKTVLLHPELRSALDIEVTADTPLRERDDILLALKAVLNLEEAEEESQSRRRSSSPTGSNSPTAIEQADEPTQPSEPVSEP